MDWIKLKSQRFKMASYDADKMMLYLKHQDGNLSLYRDIVPSSYRSFTASENQDFYFEYYIQPTQIRIWRPLLGSLLKLILFTILFVVAIVPIS